MMKYTRREIVNAEPATYGQYLMETQQPFSENKDENEFKGYMIQGPDGKVQFVDAREFNESYSSCETPEDRMNLEISELAEKIDKLEAFLSSDRVATLDDKMLSLMKDQLKVMKEYKDILIRRFALLAMSKL